MGLRNFLLNAFRELFVHHHGSLEFRAKLFALLVAVNEDAKEEAYNLIKQIGLSIYQNDEDRANLLVMSTKELVKKVQDDNGLYIDTLVANVQTELRVVPRYAKKIDIDSLAKLLDLTKNPDTLLYQKNILEFLQKLKDETLQSKKNQIAEDEQKVRSKYAS
ncbi:MAG: hypothetical protein PHS10_00450 [Thiovulaceae bacterium]|nr:hypothetical protein [Sulfurimonadaceae bacterium]